ncbi:MAG: 30S ribosomal protein S5 [Candidatus Jacksonbacteria bacterium]|jgi:small subunit ribosomal protein S5|nr:30S ribosomal protein S5 [Candidatus Jacksonbacteria bacterium]MBT6034086.1 30S ribosomal protein S5 [Candidatus Jacksonbacteria bacterium]MBT6301121.1 30S ribosomal protein S5 [Candidatus Jacksonbacteria bacterium]MBT6757296.1 30S ribosomal protein S5 [Candidatus Jacksonbacteria bacterium]MBT6955623.1 30S ribosomal protein S5 [Candidatus Jacksonbacteria bacterium]
MSQQRNQRGGDRREKSEFDQSIIDIARVTRVMAGGKRMRFRACVALGNKKGKVGIGIAKGADVQIAISKATTQAEKNMVSVHVVGGTIPHAVVAKFKAAKVMLKPAALGTGVIAGGAVRTILTLAGAENVVGKILGSQNKINNVQVTIKALLMLKDAVPEHMKDQVEAQKLVSAQREKEEKLREAEREKEEKNRPRRGRQDRRNQRSNFRKQDSGQSKPGAAPAEKKQ